MLADPRPVIYLAIAALIFSAGWKVRDWQDDAATLAATKAGDVAATRAAEAIASIKVENKTIVQRMQREIVDRPVYRECVHLPEAAAQINKALTP